MYVGVSFLYAECVSVTYLIHTAAVLVQWLLPYKAESVFVNTVSYHVLIVYQVLVLNSAIDQSSGTCLDRLFCFFGGITLKMRVL